MRILIIEDEIIIARFIENQIKSNHPSETRVALSISEVRQLIPEFCPHLVLCDIKLNDKLDGIELIRQLKKTHAFEVVFITSYQSMQTINRAFELKPANYIIKPLDESRLYAGLLPVVKQLQEKEASSSSKANMNDTLSPNELTILKLISQKKTTKEIAAMIHLSPYTIKNYRHSICRKLQLDEENNALLTWSLKNHHLIVSTA
ncbi:DNA-binding response regulator [Pedobacter sp. HMWF019]|uniref:response regulator transcription factor n=1 Tax=Pedobacter sp. HMWF019 TaxID=2056856 RepID=UPI000D3988AA|nr:response regulator transcription factor [Pedobacter sp. HMWF019]PTS99672.1 DNA-binding response regulator [Pedobacter sp. HMWF019]